MRLMELFFIVALTIWLFMPLVYLLLIRFTLDVKLTARNKASLGNHTQQDCNQ
jgi:hypothetical protein